MAKIKLDGGYNALPISYKRGNPIPLDTTSVWYDLTELETYAKEGVTAYVGQVLTLVEDNKTTVFVIVDEAGNLEPVGTTPIGDDKSIVVDEDTSTISLVGIDTLNFERDVLGEDGQPTGDKESIQYQPLMTSAGLVWIEPSKTTVEGLATLIEGLTVRMTGVEGRVTTLETNLAGEIARATAAEEALGGRIDDVNTALADYAKTADVNKTLEDYAKTTVLEDYAKTADVNKTLEDYATTDAVNTALANYTTTEALNGLLATKADKSAYDETVSTLTALKARVEAFLDDTGTVEDTLDSLQELIAYIDSHDDADIAGILASVQKIEAKLNGIEDGKTVVEFVNAEIEKLEINTFAKAEALNTLAAKVDVDSVSGAIATAKQGAIDEAKDKADAAETAAKSYADGKITEALATAADDAQTKADTAEGAAKADAANNLAAAMETVYTKDEVDTTVSGINSAINLKANASDVYTKEEIDGKTFASKAEVEAAVAAEAKRADEAEKAINATVAAIQADYVTKAEKAALEQGIETAKAAGDQGIKDAAAADAKATSNAGAIQTINAKLTTDEAQISENVAAIANHETRIAANEGAITGLQGEIAKKANADAVNASLNGLSDRVGKNEGDITNINGQISTLQSSKANTADVYTKTEIDGKVSTINTSIETAKTEAANAVNALATGAVATNTANIATNTADIKAIYSVGEDDKATGVLVDLVAAEESRAKGVEAGFEGRIAEMEKFWEAADDPNDTIDKLAEIIDYIDKHEELNIPASVEANAKAIENIYTAANGETPASGVLVNEIAAAKSYADTAASNAVAGIPDAIAQALADAKAYADKIVADETSITQTTAENGNKVFSLKSVSTDLLTNGSDELILFGGYAIDRTATPEV